MVAQRVRLSLSIFAARVVGLFSLLAGLLFFGRSTASCSTRLTRLEAFGRPEPPADPGSLAGWLVDRLGETVQAWESFSPLGFNLGACLILFWIAGRCYLYARYASFSIERVETPILGVEQLLSGQESCLRKLVDSVQQQRRHGNPLLIALRGEWGSGKSTLVTALRSRLEATARPGEIRPVVIYVDIWRHSTEPDLHLALFEELLSHPAVPVFPAFFRYPLSLLPVVALRGVTKIFDRGQFELSGFKASLTLPALLWQKSLERAVSRVVARRGAIVWILDEIDRCTPEMAQAAIALTRRALSLPGSVIVLPYVREQLRFKAFNPLITGRSDISSTMRALVWEHALQKEGAIGSLFARGKEPWNEPWSPKHLGGGGEDRPSMIERGRSIQAQIEPGATVERMLTWGVMRQFIELESSDRLRLEYLFEEKYLAREVEVPQLRDDEVGEMMWKIPLLRAHCEALLSGALAAFEQRFREDLGRLIPLALERYRRSVGKRAGYLPGRRSPAIRHLEGEISSFLDRLPPAAAHLDPESRYRVLVHATLLSVLLGYRRAWEMVTWRPWKG